MRQSVSIGGNFRQIGLLSKLTTTNLVWIFSESVCNWFDIAKQCKVANQCTQIRKVLIFLALYGYSGPEDECGASAAAADGG